MPSTDTPLAAPHRLSRRQLLTAVAAGTVVSSCSPYFLGQAQHNSGLHVLAANWGQIYNDSMIHISSAYERSHPDSEINWTFAEDWQTKLLTQIGGNVPPDIAYSNWAEQTTLASTQTFLSLDEYADAASLTRADFVRPMYDACQWDGHMYALPGGADYNALYWSKDVYRDAGLDPEQPPHTADELIEHSLQILRTNSNGDITRIGYIPTSFDYIQWALLFGGSFYDEDTGQPTAAHDGNIEALEWLLRYVKKLNIDKLTAFSELPDYSQPGNPFAAGKSAYLYTGFWAFDALDQYAPDLDYGVAFLPTVRGTDEERARYLITGWMYAIPRNCRRPDEAWEFMKYALVDHAGEMGYQTLNGPCFLDQFGIFRAGLRDKLGADNRLVPYLDVFTQIGELGREHWPTIRADSYYFDQVVRAYDLVVRGKESPADALADVERNVTAKLQEPE